MHNVGAPSRVCVTMAFSALRSAAHIFCIESANHAMFALHWSKLVSVLHVPQMRSFSVVMFD